ncbi:hypothetical protein BH20CHL6_BH20CHL6_17290 [soil metagenome]
MGAASGGRGSDGAGEPGDAGGADGVGVVCEVEPDGVAAAVKNGVGEGVLEADGPSDGGDEGFTDEGFTDA